MPTFEVDITEERTFRYTVKAKDEEEALTKVFERSMKRTLLDIHYIKSDVYTKVGRTHG